MATEKIIDIKLNYEQTKRGLKEINSELLEQKDILILLEEEFLKAKQALDAYNASNTKNLAQEKQLKEALKERKAALEDQRLGIRKIQQEQRVANDAYKNYNRLTNENTQIVRGIDKLTGGYATKILKLGKGFKSSVKAVKTFALSLKGLRGALIATGIGALVVALGTIIAYWDEISGAINGVSSQQKDLLDTQTKSVEQSEKQSQIIKDSENTLRLQGKTEKEIVELKKAQLNETIKNLEAQLVTQESIKKTQIEAAERNKKIAKGIIAFLSAPLLIITGLIDGITNTLASLGVLEEGTALTEGFLEKTSSMLFDPEEVAEEGDKTIQETKDKLRKLKNTRDGFILKEEADRKKKNEKELKELEKQNKERLRLEKEYQERLKNLKDRIRDAEAITQEEQRALQLEKMKEEHAALMAEALANGLLSQELIQSLREREQELKQSFKDEDDAKKLEAQQEQRDLQQMEIEAEYAFQDAKMGAMNAGLGILQKFAGENKALSAALLVVEKGLAIAEVITGASRAIATAKFNLASIPAFIAPAVPNPAFVKQAAITAKGIATTKIAAKTSIATIAAQAIPGLSGGGGGASAGSLGGGGGTETQAPSFNIVGASETNQLAQTIGEQTQQPVQAYVVANDVTTAQSLENNIVEGATL
jgi:hypothetical protein